MRILNNAKDISKRIFHRRNLNPFADILHFLMNGRAELDDSFEGGFRIFDTPISHRSVGFVRCITASRLQTKFVTGHIETNVKRLVEIRFQAEQFAIPGFTFFDIVNPISRSAQTNKHVFLPLYPSACQKPDRQGGQPALADARASDTNARIKLRRSILWHAQVLPLARFEMLREKDDLSHMVRIMSE